VTCLKLHKTSHPNVIDFLSTIKEILQNGNRGLLFSFFGNLAENGENVERTIYFSSVQLLSKKRVTL